MRRLILCALFVSLSLTVAVSVRPSTPRARADFPAAELSTNLLFECLQDGSIRAHFTWLSSGQGQQWVDLSLFDNAFAASTFLGTGPLPAGQSSLAWDGLIPNAVHYVRVNTLAPSGWAPSQTLIFATPNDCPLVVLSGAPPAGMVSCPVVASNLMSGCVSTGKPGFGIFAVGEIVNFCYLVSEPGNIRILVTKPDGTSLLVVDGFVSGTGACIGPFQANVPLGLRTVRMFGGSDLRLLWETHFVVQ